jgi:transposase-like protein
MPAWPGGPCPDCGEEIPALVIRCITCGALLNRDLKARRVALPDYVPLREVESVIDVRPIGYYISCPHCRDELRVHGKYLGQRVQCKHCKKPFEFTLSPGGPPVAFYTNCPHCNKEIRAAQKYMGAKVACKLCNGALQFVQEDAAKSGKP